ncbi:MAG TPA: nucleotidyltransferase family protein [Bacteroidales bacterium]|nr:nucleotidyltransferase family protein [Bacteroidales bacterium]HOH21945.1 nucleotidyltransferase family protein [Bacteroidales bacterium]HPZ03524.1 nucleotidyltransferase family protein [Bacteroidales bacterium]HQB74866.1 nucleotidyltransferase family protein [Bacteroidales bacterium]
MICKEAIILAGGFGTRLQSVISDVPKPMAPVGGKPFLYYILKYISSFGLNRVVLSVGYRHETIMEYFGDKFEDVELVYAIENQPLGTGGAVKFSLNSIQSETFFLLNGDSFFKSDLRELASFHKRSRAKITLSLKELQNFDRYGSVEMDQSGIVTQFQEKRFCQSGLINTGVYIVDKEIVNSVNAEKFSFEKDVLEIEVKNKTVYGIVSNGYFIDIGIPEDYEKVQGDINQLLR